ncbi:hypothetical protein [Frischella perrara]|uniref:hypothetical protein n=1 Tax=Frischella perrara TaxID=1267021 RepID=UPI0023F39777|nr:hypothetical protein [Frischella perrara]MCT6876295.1 hypothetical protein [Frischella perrara]
MNESVKRKSKGRCPFCKKKIRPIIIEENTLRRDKCKCPACNEIIYVCRIFGCQNYAKGSESYDDECCPKCAKGIKNTIGCLSKVILLTVGPIIAKKIANEISNNKK